MNEQYAKEYMYIDRNGLPRFSTKGDLRIEYMYHESRRKKPEYEYLELRRWLYS